MNSDHKTIEIRQKMAAVRQSLAKHGTEIHSEVNAIKGSVNKALDVKHQVLSHPVLASAFAGILGFFLIPKRNKKFGNLQAEKFEQLIADLREKFGINQQTLEPSSDSTSWTKSAFELAKGFAIQTLISQGKKHLLTYLAKLAMNSNHKNNSSSDKDEKATSQSITFWLLGGLCAGLALGLVIKRR